jgi:hypothetical protein
MPIDTSTPLVDLLRQASPCFLTPLSFFVSWKGVLTLAFEGWPVGISDLKTRLSAAHPGLPPELSGSRWPKATIGCIAREDQTLTPSQLEGLTQLCKTFSSRHFPPSAAPPQIALDAAAVVIYENRCLERLLSCQVVMFEGSVDARGPLEEEAQRVKAILAEADDPEYHKAVIQQGHRELHYTQPALGATLCHFLRLQTTGMDSPRRHVRAALLERGTKELEDRRKLVASIDAFRASVDAMLPGMYRWFDESSLHITLRALIV